MSANTLTGVIPTIYKAVDRVLREQTGFLGAVYMDPSAEMVDKDQNITYPIVPTMSASDVTPAAVPTDPTGMTVGYGTMSISKVRKVPFRWSGEEQASINGLYEGAKADQIAQAIRTLISEMETDLFTVQQTDIIELVADMMDWRKVRYLPVEDGKGKLAGLVTSRLLLRHFVKNRNSKKVFLVSDVMIKNPYTVTQDGSLLEAMKIM